MKKIGVVGAGTMGQGIAASFASNGYQVTVCDIKIEWAQSGIDKIAANYDKLAAKGKITAEAVASIKGNPATVCRRCGTPANLAASIPIIPALGVWVWTICGFSFLKKFHICQSDFKS